MNPAKKQTTMPEIEERLSGFMEINCGYTLEDALFEADRCLNCKHQPCVSACPIHVPIPTFISLLKDQKIDEAHQVILSRSNFPQICSRVCHVAHQCEGSCVRAIKGEAVGISHLERFVSDHATKQPFNPQSSTGKQVAVIGAGVSGLACAQDLAMAGVAVDLFEKESEIGGIALLGIPSYRLPKTHLHQIYQDLLALGVQFHFNTVLGESVLLDDLTAQYDAVFLGIGEEDQVSLDFEGQVLCSNDFLKQIYAGTMTDLKNQRVIVMGGGNTAMDCARSSKRLGAQVTVCYRRRIDDMPAAKFEIEQAMLEDVTLMPLVSPIKFDNGKLECVRRVVSGLDEAKRVNTIEVEGSNFKIDCDLLILALGSTPNRVFREQVLGCKLDQKGRLVVDEAFRTSREKVYAGGDLVFGADTVVKAVDAGKKAAKSILNELNLTL